MSGRKSAWASARTSVDASGRTLTWLSASLSASARTLARPSESAGASAGALAGASAGASGWTSGASVARGVIVAGGRGDVDEGNGGRLLGCVLDGGYYILSHNLEEGAVLDHGGTHLSREPRMKVRSMLTC